MKTTQGTDTTKRLNRSRSRLTKANLDALVEEAIVDCYNQSEQATALCNMLEENLRLPFEAEVLGIAVTVIGVEITYDDQIVAVCERGGLRQKLPILELPLPTPRPAGSQWIDTYRHWARGA